MIANLLLSRTLNRPVVLFMSYKEAECVKLFANSYLAMRVAFFNELDSYCIENRLNTENVIKGVCYDSRIGNSYNRPSFGFGGYCLPKDSYYVATNMMTEDYSSVIKSLSISNDLRMRFMLKTFLSKYPNNTQRVIGIYNVGSERHSVLEILGCLLHMYYMNIIYYSETESLDEFKNKCDVIITDKMYEELRDVKEKVFTRDTDSEWKT